jgi:hypothetical protein
MIQSERQHRLAEMDAVEYITKNFATEDVANFRPHRATTRLQRQVQKLVHPFINEFIRICKKLYSVRIMCFNQAARGKRIQSNMKYRNTNKFRLEIVTPDVKLPVLQYNNGLKTPDGFFLLGQLPHIFPAAISIMLSQ